MVNIELVREGYARVLTVPRNVLYERPLSPGKDGREGGFMLTTYPRGAEYPTRLSPPSDRGSEVTRVRPRATRS